MVELVKKEVEVPKEVSELAEGLGNIAIAALEATKDGFQAGQDVPVIVTASLTELPKMVDGLSEVDDEWKEYKAKFLIAWMLSGEKVFSSIEARKKLPEVPPVA
jgi:hypothetical protein